MSVVKWVRKEGKKWAYGVYKNETSTHVGTAPSYTEAIHLNGMALEGQPRVAPRVVPMPWIVDRSA